MNTLRLATHLIAATLLAAPWAVHGEAFYSGAGLASSMVGYTKPLSSNLSLRAELDSLPGIGRESIDEGVSYTRQIKSDHASLFMDGYTAAIMRFIGGTTFNRTRVDLRASGDGGLPLFGEVPHSTTLNERFDSALRAPHTLPYLGAGNGQSSASGSSFLLDIGGTFARASLSDRPSGPSLGAVSQTALDHELAQLRSGMGRARFMRQVSLGMHLRF
jgi:hypothetical protein